MTILYLTGYLVTLLFIHEIVRRSKYVAFAFSFILPICLTIYWSQFNHDFFVWVKMYSVIFAMEWLFLCRFTVLSGKHWALNFINIILIINIAEATMVDLFNYHWLNAIAGFLLIFSILLIGTKSIRIADSKNKDLMWDTPITWVIGYTLWNITFIYNNYVTDLWIHTVVLGAPLLIAFYRTAFWAQARAIVLYVFLVNSFTFRSTIVPLEASLLYNQSISSTLSLISMLWVLIFTINLICKKTDFHSAILTAFNLKSRPKNID